MSSIYKASVLRVSPDVEFRVDEMSEKQLPKWNREVRAALILEVKEGGELVLEGGVTIYKVHAWMNRNHPDAGQYYVVSHDGMRDWLVEADEFEKVHTRVDEKEHA